MTLFILFYREGSIFYGIDTFHERKTFISPKYIFGDTSNNIEAIAPVHGFGRNILPSFIAEYLSSSNHYLSRILNASWYSFVYVSYLLSFFCVSQSLELFVLVSALFAAFGIAEGHDINIFLIGSSTLLLLFTPKYTSKKQLLSGIFSSFSLSVSFL